VPNIENIAATALAKIDQLIEANAAPEIVKLTRYDRDGYHELRADGPLSFEQQEHLTDLVAEGLEFRGIPVGFVTIDRNDYMVWLADRENTSKTRAEYISFIQTTNAQVPRL